MALALDLQLVSLKRLDWDTAFFGASMGAITLTNEPSSGTPAQRAEVLRNQLLELLATARREGYQHLIFRAATDDLATTWAAEGAGLRLVDVGIDSTIRLPVDAARLSEPSLVVRPARTDEVLRLCDLGAAFTLSRFTADPFFSTSEVVAFHRQWIANLCAGLAATNLVCEVDGQLAGFVSCTLVGDEGRIALIATDARFRRRGVGADLVNAALNWFSTAGARVAHVKTQAHNYPALALYHRAGFNVSKSELTFSIVLDKQRNQGVQE